MAAGQAVMKYAGNISQKELKQLHKSKEQQAVSKRRVRTVCRMVLNIAMAFLILSPLLYAISIAFMPSSELYSQTLNLIPKNPTLENFAQAITTVPLFRFVLNSFIVSLSIMAGQIVTCSLAAFAFSFLEFKGKGVLFMVVMATMMVPGEATIISNYLTVSSWGWLDTYYVLIIPYLTSATGIFMFRQFYSAFPISLYEAAKLDGCSNLRFISTILVPLTKPAIGAMAVYTFINSWNMYMWPLLVTGSQEKRTVQIGISMLNSVDAQSMTMMIAGVVIVVIPSLSIFVIGQKQLVRGMFSGAVKG
ncbi:MAG: carbohydrate ABC transporter permease [Clostridiales bacterium]|nr:carbohydrate ABC transporter permease [Clostridiales bacterium]